MLDFLCTNPMESYIPKQKQVPISFIRILHASYDCPRIDVYSNGHLIAKNLSYKKFNPYLTVPAGHHNIKIFKSGGKGSLILNTNIDLIEDSIYTAVLITGSPSPEIFLVPDPKISIDPEKSKIRFVHLCPEELIVDVALSEKSALFTDIGYKQICDYVSCNSEKYTLQVKSREREHPILNIPNIILKPGWNSTIYFIGNTHDKHGLQCLILLDGSTYIIKKQA